MFTHISNLSLTWFPFSQGGPTLRGLYGRQKKWFRFTVHRKIKLKLWWFDDALLFHALNHLLFSSYSKQSFFCIAILDVLLKIDCTANIKPNTYLTSCNIRLLLFFRFILGWSLAFWEWLWCCYWWPLWSWCVETSRRSLTSIPWCLRVPCQIVTWWEISLPLLVMGPLSPPNCMTNQSTKRALPYITNPIGKSSISCLFTILHNVVLFFNKVGFATK